MTDVFPGVDYAPVDLDRLKEEIIKVCGERNLAEPIWMDKIIQLYQIQNIHYGLMMVGPSGMANLSPGVPSSPPWKRWTE
ncbi:dynein heavy chain [Entomophthora muscae]|uniref:Dynein heavy chain n=1 Tax=Entomophthora muscae TaxID=34485 RepID=A0ACC2SYW0_9FUNG|nr:dynein heavy chain [Entomophthora muscae]